MEPEPRPLGDPNFVVTQFMWSLVHNYWDEQFPYFTKTEDYPRTRSTYYIIHPYGSQNFRLFGRKQKIAANEYYMLKKYGTYPRYCSGTELSRDLSSHMVTGAVRRKPKSSVDKMTSNSIAEAVPHVFLHAPKVDTRKRKKLPPPPTHRFQNNWP